MKLLINILIGFIAFLHLYFFWFESFTWTTKGPKIFKHLPKDLFPKTKAMMANQGLYNAFLAAGLIWTFFMVNDIWKFNTALFFLACIAIAGIIGALTVSKKIFFIQGIPAILTIGLLFLSKNPMVSSELPDPLAAGWNGESVCEVVQEDAKIRVLRCTFPPGVGHEKHEHAPHFGYTVKGSTFEIKDKYSSRKVKVLTGSYFYKPRTSVHEVLNVGDSTAVFLIIEPK